MFRMCGRHLEVNDSHSEGSHQIPLQIGSPAGLRRFFSARWRFRKPVQLRVVARGGEGERERE